MRRGTIIALSVFALSCATAVDAKTIKIGIGHQSMCSDTYTAGIIVKELKLSDSIN